MFHLSVSDVGLLLHSHISLLVMDRERGGHKELLGVANLSLAEVPWCVATSRRVVVVVVHVQLLSL